MESKRINFEIERGKLASSAMMKFKDIFMKLGVIETSVNDGLRTYRFQQIINNYDREDYDNALQGVSEKTVDGLYEAYAEMNDGSYDALWEPGDFSEEEKAKGHDRTYNKNADEVIREEVSLPEVLEAFINFRNDGEIAKSKQSSEPAGLERE